MPPHAINGYAYCPADDTTADNWSRCPNDHWTVEMIAHRAVARRLGPIVIDDAPCIAFLCTDFKVLAVTAAAADAVDGGPGTPPPYADPADPDACPGEQARAALWELDEALERVTGLPELGSAVARERAAVRAALQKLRDHYKWIDGLYPKGWAADGEDA